MNTHKGLLSGKVQNLRDLANEATISAATDCPSSRCCDNELEPIGELRVSDFAVANQRQRMRFERQWRFSVGAGFRLP